MARVYEGVAWRKGDIEYRAFLGGGALQFRLTSDKPFPPGTAAHIVVAYDTGQCFERLHSVVFIDNPPSRVSTLAFDERSPLFSLSAERPFLYRVALYRMVGGRRVPGVVLTSGGREKPLPERPLRPGAPSPRGKRFPSGARREFERVCRGVYDRTLQLSGAEVEDFINSENPRMPKPPPGDIRGDYALGELIDRAYIRLVELGLKPVATIGAKAAVVELARKNRDLNVFEVPNWIRSAFVVSRAGTVEEAIGGRIERAAPSLPNPRGVLEDYEKVKQLTIVAGIRAIIDLPNYTAMEGLMFGYRPCCVRHVLDAYAPEELGNRVARRLGVLGRPIAHLCRKIADHRLGPRDPCGLLTRCPGCRSRDASPREYFSWWQEAR